MQLYQHILKDCVWTRSLQIAPLRVIREMIAEDMEHTQAGMNLDSVCIAKIVTKSQFLLIKAALFLSKWERLPSPIIFLKRLYCIFSHCIRQVLQFSHNYFICSPLSCICMCSSSPGFIFFSLPFSNILFCPEAQPFSSLLPWNPSCHGNPALQHHWNKEAFYF